jgi:hypothetical protein
MEEGWDVFEIGLFLNLGRADGRESRSTEQIEP